MKIKMNMARSSTKWPTRGMRRRISRDDVESYASYASVAVSAAYGVRPPSPDVDQIQQNLQSATTDSDLVHMRARHVLIGALLLPAACVSNSDTTADTDRDTQMHCDGAVAPSRLTSYLAQADVDGADCIAIESDGRIIVRFGVPGENAIQIWERLAEMTDGFDYWPILLGDEETADSILLFAGDDSDESLPSPEQILDDAKDIDFTTWLEEQTAFVTDSSGQLPTDGQTYPASGADHRYMTPRDISSGAFLDTVVIAIVPAANSWESAAFLKWGCWNAVPCPEEHVAVMREWNERYGAEVVAMSSDIVEMRVARPPTDWDSALQLAYEQYVYDSDIVNQGTGSIERLAPYLVGSSGWSFWWD